MINRTAPDTAMSSPFLPIEVSGGLCDQIRKMP